MNPLSKSYNDIPTQNNTDDTDIDETPSTPPISIPPKRNTVYGHNFNYNSSSSDIGFEPSSHKSFDYYAKLKEKKDNSTTASRNNVYSTSLSDDTTSSKIEDAKQKRGSFSIDNLNEHTDTDNCMFQFEEELNSPGYFNNLMPYTFLQFGYEQVTGHEENITHFFHIGSKKLHIKWDNDESNDFFDLETLSFFKTQLEEYYLSTFNQMEHSALIYLYKKELEHEEPEYYLFYIENGPKLFHLTEGESPQLLSGSDLLKVRTSDSTFKISLSDKPFT